MALEITGKLIKQLPTQTGSGKNGTWTKQDFILETTDQYPKKICVTAWGDLTDHIDDAEIGDLLTVSINLESREYNDRWYTEVKAWKISAGKTTKNKPAADKDIPLVRAEEVDGDDLPF